VRRAKEENSLGAIKQIEVFGILASQPHECLGKLQLGPHAP
jgi:hypothetical protein